MFYGFDVNLCPGVCLQMRCIRRSGVASFVNPLTWVVVPTTASEIASLSGVLWLHHRLHAHVSGSASRPMAVKDLSHHNPLASYVERERLGPSRSTVMRRGIPS